MFCRVGEDSDMLRTLLRFHSYRKGVYPAGDPDPGVLDRLKAIKKVVPSLALGGNRTPLPPPLRREGNSVSPGKSAGCSTVTAAITLGAVTHMFAVAVKEPTEYWNARSEARCLESYPPPASSVRGAPALIDQGDSAS